MHLVCALISFLELLKEREITLSDLLGLVLVLCVARRHTQWLRNGQSLLRTMLRNGVACGS